MLITELLLASKSVLGLQHHQFVDAHHTRIHRRLPTGNILYLSMSITCTIHKALVNILGNKLLQTNKSPIPHPQDPEH